eukprot:PhF_6_TR30746/c0_g1_i1/m.45261
MAIKRSRTPQTTAQQQQQFSKLKTPSDDEIVISISRSLLSKLQKYHCDGGCIHALDLSVMLSLSRSDQTRLQKSVYEILRVMNSELGIVEDSSVSWQRIVEKNKTLYIYVDGGGFIRGSLLVEAVQTARKLMSLRERDREGIHHLHRQTSTSESVVFLPSPYESADDEESEQDNDIVAWAHQTHALSFTSEVLGPVMVGVERIWVHENHRKQGIASLMLDVARRHFV